MVLFLKNVFSALIMRFFGKKLENFQFRKIRKYDEEGTKKNLYFVFSAIDFLLILQ